MAYVQSRAATVPLSATPTLAFNSNVGANSTLAVACSVGIVSGTISPPTDTLLNIYTPVETLDDVSTDELVRLWVAPCPVGGANTVTLHLSATPTDGAWLITEYSGRDTTTPIGNHTQATQATPGTGANVISCGPITAVAGDDILLFMADVGGINANSLTAGTSPNTFTERVESAAGGSTLDQSFSDCLNVGAGSFTATGGQANNDRTISMVVGLKAAAGAGASGNVGESAGWAPNGLASLDTLTRFW
jgi:hypothetical protein